MRTNGAAMGLRVAALALLAAPALAGAGERSWTLEDEQKALRFTLTLSAGQLSYAVDHLAADGSAAAVVQRSPLGIERKDASF